MNRTSNSWFFAGCIGLTLATGCGQKKVDLPKFKPQKLAQSAMEMFDKDSDGNLTGEELDACPGIKDGTRQLDQDNDGKISEDEIAERVQSWLDSKTGGLPASVKVTYKGKPLDGATVTFEPEPFLEGVIAPSKGITALSGKTELKCDALPFGTQAGFYRVTITKDGESLPEKYNSATELGAEVSNESRGVMRGRFEFDLD